MARADWILLLGFAAYAVASGLRNRARASRDLEAYFLAGRTLSGWRAGLSMAATQFAAYTPLLVTGIVAVSGIFALWQLWIYALAFLMMGFLLAGSWRRARVITDAELTELRYGQKPAAVLRLVKALYFGTVFNCTVLAWVFFAAAKVSEPFLLWHEWLPAPVFLQIVIMLGGTLFFAVAAVGEAGGLGAVRSRLDELFAAGGPGGITPRQILAFTPGAARNASFSLLALFALQWLIQLNADGTGYLAQRSMACRSVRDAKIAAVVFTFTQVLVRSLLWLPLALALLVLYPPDPSVPSHPPWTHTSTGARRIGPTTSTSASSAAPCCGGSRTHAVSCGWRAAPICSSSESPSSS